MTFPSGAELIFIVAAAAAVFWIAKTLLHSWRARKWELVTGQIEHASFSRFGVQSGRGPHNQKVGAKIDYSFSHQGERYGGIVGLVGFSSDAKVDEYVRAIPDRASIFVRFDPQHPDSSEVRLSDNPQLNVKGIYVTRNEPAVEEIVDLMPK